MTDSYRTWSKFNEHRWSILNARGHPTHANLSAPIGTTSPAVPRNIEQRLISLKELLDKGLITMDDYTQTRSRIISEL